MIARPCHIVLLAATALLLPALPWAARAEAPATAPAAAPQARAGAPSDRAVVRRSGDGIEGRPIGDGPSTSGGWVQTVIALAIVVVLIFALRLVLRRLAGGSYRGRAAQPIEVLARTHLASRQQLSLVRLGRRLVLVGSCPTGMSPLAEVTDPAEVAELLAGPKPVEALAESLAAAPTALPPAARADLPTAARPLDPARPGPAADNVVSRSIRDLTAKIRSRLPDEGDRT